MTISASAVKELRERSGAGMMECKNALVATNGDLEAALEHLRKSGAAKAAKKAGRIAAEGAVVIAEGNGAAALVEVNSETDFAANEPNFAAFADAVARTVLNARPADLEALAAATLDGSSETVEAGVAKSDPLTFRSESSTSGSQGHLVAIETEDRDALVCGQ